MLTYLLEMPPELDYDYSEEPNENKPSYVQVMMSVPYNLNSYHAYLAVGIDNMYLNSTGIFDQIYYYTGPFERAQAGSLVEYTSEDGKGIYKSYFLLLNDDILTRKPSEKKPQFKFSIDFGIFFQNLYYSYFTILRISMTLDNALDQKSSRTI